MRVIFSGGWKLAHFAQSKTSHRDSFLTIAFNLGNAEGTYKAYMNANLVNFVFVLRCP